MSYYRSLAFELRLRGVPEDAVSAELIRVANLSADRDPTDEFGTPSGHAALFEKQKHKNASSRLIVLGGLLLLVALLVQLGSLVLWRTEIRPLAFPLFAAMLPVFGAVLLTALALEMRLPRQFRRHQRGDGGATAPLD